MAKRKVRILFKPARAPKWWPRDKKGKSRFVGVTLDGYGWDIGPGDRIDASKVDEISENLRFDYGPKTRIVVSKL